MLANLHAEPRPSPAANDMAWLTGLRARVQAIVSELSQGYPVLLTPRLVEDAISDLESAADSLTREISRVDDEGDPR